MRRMLMILILILFLAVPGLSREGAAASIGEGSVSPGHREAETAAGAGEGIQKYAPDNEALQKDFGVQPVHDNQIFATFEADRFEHQWRDEGEELLLWDVMVWAGTDYNKLILESEGEYTLDPEEMEEAGAELFYGRTIAKFWDLKAGIRHDFKPSPSGSFIALGFQGLAPLWFEVDATAYLSEDGDVSAKLEAEYELLLTQRLILAPRTEIGLSAQDVPENETWQGITDLTLGCRLMYHFYRELAPYIGLSWKRNVGETAHNIDKKGGDVESTALVAGLRFWF